MSKERDVEILKYKIADLERKIKEFTNHNISEKKTANLRILKLKYESDLEEILAQ
jgi:hypothetical protein